MSDFVQTMKDWRRMCMAMEKLRPQDSCAGCRLEGYGCPAIYEDNSHVDFRDVEKQVSAWAAEHPEPRYPTWGEWLISVGAARKIPTGIPFELQDGSIVDPPWETVVDVNTPIPADIAQKLGIEPKEG